MTIERTTINSEQNKKCFHIREEDKRLQYTGRITEILLKHKLGVIT
jgi:hypothetical protein